MNTSNEQEQESSVELRPLPIGWSWASLGELGLVRLGKTPRKSDYRDLSDHKIVKFRDVDEHGQVDWHNPVKGFVDSSPEVIRTLKDLQKNDVLVTASAHMSEHIGKKVGIVANIPGQFKGAYVVGEILQVRARENIEPKWILYYLRSTDGYKAIQRRVHGVHLISSRAQNIEIPVAPLDQQERIVAEIEKQFSRLDEAVANLKRVKANLKRYKAAVLKAAVEGRLVESEAEHARREGRNYVTGAQLLQRILETRRSQWQGKGKYKEPAAPDTTDLPELPEGWVWAKIGQLCFLDSGEAFKKADYSSDGLRLLQIANVGFSQVEWVQRNYLPLNFGEKFPELLLQDGDIVLALNRPIIGGRLKVASVSKKDLPAILYQRVGRLRPTTGGSPAYLFNFFQSPHMLAGVRKRLQGTDQPYLNTSLVPDITVPFPPLAEQHRIVAEVDRHLTLLRQTEAQVDASLQRAKRLHQSILRQAFAGRVLPIPAT